MKKISVVIPCYSEEKSIQPMYERLVRIFHDDLPNYDYEIIYLDDYSPDNTREEIEKICKKDKKVKAVFNAKNFGFIRNVFSSLKEGNGDAVFMLFGDLQDPPELLPKFITEWEKGKKVVIGQKKHSDENRFMYFIRTVYYKIMKSLSTVEHIEHFNGFGLYDKDFIDIIKQIDDPIPYFRGIVSEFGMKQSVIQYDQAKSNRGYSGTTFLKNYDVAMTGITSYTKTLMRVSTFIGLGLAVLSLLLALFVFIHKLLNWESYPTGTASIMIGVFFLGAIQLFFIGILGEYMLSINARSVKKPLTIVEKRINFGKKD
jgi:glycosyltransferase involved in cell wall biosynthesis